MLPSTLLDVQFDLFCPSYFSDQKLTIHACSRLENQKLELLKFYMFIDNRRTIEFVSTNFQARCTSLLGLVQFGLKGFSFLEYNQGLITI